MQPRKISIEFERSSTYTVQPIHGGWGGIVNGDSIQIDLYTEHKIAPKSQTINIVEGESGLEAHASTDDEFNYVRTLHVGAIMSSRTARQIATWLLTKANEVDRISEDGPTTAEDQDERNGTVS